MEKKYIVRLSETERTYLRKVVKQVKGSYEKIRRAQILLKADINGPNWTDKKIAEAFDCRTKTVENLRSRLVTEGFETVLNGKKQGKALRPKLLNGEQEAQIIAMRLGSPPDGYGSWSLRLLRDRVIELGIVDSLSHETVRRTLKKTVLQKGSCSIG